MTAASTRAASSLGAELAGGLLLDDRRRQLAGQLLVSGIWLR